MAKADLTAQALREILHYDPDTGIFTRLANGAKAGAISHGYLAAMVDGKTYRCHRLAWLYMTGEWPKNCVDHINGIRSDNRWINLRDISHQANIHNAWIPHRQNTTGFLGIFKKRSKWEARIRIDGKQIRLGIFTTPEAAQSAYMAAKTTLLAGLIDVGH